MAITIEHWRHGRILGTFVTTAVKGVYTFPSLTLLEGDRLLVKHTEEVANEARNRT